MTKKTPTPTAQHMQKLADLMDARPEGVNLRQVQNTLSVSPTLAKAALIEIGATEVEGKWVFAEPVAVAEPAPVEPVTIEPEPELKKLTQAVFDGLPSEYRWAAVDANGEAHLYNRAPELSVANDVFGYFTNFAKGDDYLDLGDGYDASDWQNSLIERVDVPTIVGIDWAENMTAPVEPEPVAKSDFAVALEAERQRVYDAVAIGGTVERLAELTGLHVDDVQQHLDALIVDGAIFREPIIIGYGHKVAV